VEEEGGVEERGEEEVRALKLCRISCTGDLAEGRDSEDSRGGGRERERKTREGE
jgi:hypothetical protein